MLTAVLYETHGISGIGDGLGPPNRTIVPCHSKTVADDPIDTVVLEVSGHANVVRSSNAREVAVVIIAESRK